MLCRLNSVCLCCLQVSQVFDLKTSACSGELMFMERYKEVLQELEQVEQKMESQSVSSSSSSSEGLGVAAVSGTGRCRLGSSGRSTLQAIGSAAAAGFSSSCRPTIRAIVRWGCDSAFFPAGVAFYSVSDIADRLLSTPVHPVPSLEEDYWLGPCVSDPSGLLSTLLEELSPAAMAAFDLACCRCHLWKTSRQLLDTAERRLHSSLEARGGRPKGEGYGFSLHAFLLPIQIQPGLKLRLELAQHRSTLDVVLMLHGGSGIMQDHTFDI